MQIQVFMGSASEGKTSKLQSVQDRLDFTGESAPIIQAEAYGEDGLLEILEVRAAGGQREILVDDCSRQQILRVLEWQSCVEHEPNLDDLVIHLARKD
ncbi:hypothetical protein C9383_07335 [Pseudomonas palleroniana]|uniref:Uncharacterized protein n=1 Tax=Pseudomonas palleroniana TaxID=191390 RepID=A0A1H5MQG6_9PSED|nr:hypothetical protein [Pseudomonas palleroniana]KAB0564283.1 hypothetical protein F7R03_23160 [Pseudomonas palleroniana]PTC29488.1 hypothetical protein C9383_07335 [Pseudomonas palleroniana]SEE91609.1 hypothetical protein SAMN04490198_3517 [Pseudomonas palleroniana]